jgi:hypothetical protein
MKHVGEIFVQASSSYQQLRANTLSLKLDRSY